MFYQKCGSELEDKALFCTECGAKIKHDKNKAQGANETRSVEPISIPVDNSPQQAKSVENAPQAQKTGLSKKQKISIGILIAVVVILAVTLVVVVVLHPTKDVAKQETQTSQESTEEQTTTQNKYILENSATKELTDADIANLTNDEICIAQNEIWARHGRKFKNNWLQDYFNKQSWYSGTIEADDFLNKYSPSDIENTNAQFLSTTLSSRGYELNKAHPNDAQTSSTTSEVESLTQELKNAGYNLVVQGQVRYHTISISDDKISAIPYIRLDNSVEISGYQATEHRVRNTQTICPTYSSDEKFGNAEQIFRRLEGHQVLIGINNDSYDVQFATDSVCSFQTHTREECDLVNYGWVTYVTNFEVKDLGNTQ